MTRRTFITIAIGVLFALFMALLWWWFFAAGGAPAPKPAGSFGSATDRSATTQGGTGQNGGGSSNIGAGEGQSGQNAGQGGLNGTLGAGTSGSGTTGLGTYGSGTTGSGANGSGTTGSGTYGSATPNSGQPTSGYVALSGSGAGSLYGSNTPPAGVSWLSGGGVGSGSPTPGNLGSAGYGYGGSGLQSGAPGSGTPTIGNYNPSAPSGPINAPGGPSGPGGPLAFNSGNGTQFTPTQINNLNTNQIYGDVSVQGTAGSNNGSTNNGLAIGLIGGTAVACSAFLAQGQLASLFPGLAVPANDTSNNTKSFMDCLMRTIARAALQQMTNSIVQWINSGFNGSPSFVTNYQQFFQSVADQAAGNFIANVANFSPMCTPFRAQIRIALAQSYARRNTAQSCSLSTLLGTNTQGLFSGKGLNANGWSNLLQFTTVPSNNPYGSYMSVQTNFANSLSSANQNASRNMTPSGFLNFQQVVSCNPGVSQSATVAGTCPTGCRCKVATPGSVIEAAGNKALGSGTDYLTQAGISGSFDAIINALLTQLTQKALYGGLSSASSQDYSFNSQTFDQQTAQAQGQYLLNQLRSMVTVAQQYGQTKQGSIRDIEAVQTSLNTLANCWQAAASTTADGTKQQQAAQNASSTLAQLHAYDAQVASLNSDITRANAAVAMLQDMETQALSVGSTADVAKVQASYDAAQNGGQLIVPTDLTTAQQDRTTLQSQLNGVSQTTQTSLQQCNAFNQTTN